MYDQNGAAAEYVCLPHDPSMIINIASTNPWENTAQNYGAEYQDNVFSSNVFLNFYFYKLKRNAIITLPMTL
jgi:hypothetical protein